MTAISEYAKGVPEDVRTALDILLNGTKEEIELVCILNCKDREEKRV